MTIYVTGEKLSDSEAHKRYFTTKLELHAWSSRYYKCVTGDKSVLSDVTPENRGHIKHDKKGLAMKNIDCLKYEQ